jgi:hypothetical protein
MDSFSNLPMDVVNTILSYNKNFAIRKGVAVTIIPKDDYRYKINYKRVPIIKNYSQYGRTYDAKLGKNFHLLLHYFTLSDTYIFSLVKRFELIHYDILLNSTELV